MRKPPLKIAVAASVVLVFVACLALMIHAGSRLGEMLAGPSKLANSPDGTIWVISHGRLHQFDNDGTRMRAVALRDLHLDDTMSGIAVADADTLFLAQAEPSRVYRCVLSRSTCTDLTPAIHKTAGPTRFALMLAVENKTKQLLIADNGGHRLLLSDVDGNILDVSAPRAFRFPNQPSWISDNEIAVPDTNHHRIAVLAVKDGKLAEQRAEFFTGGGRFGRAGRIWPMDAQRARDGTWWVLNAQDRMRNADLVRFDAAGNAVARVDLGDKSDPTAIAISGNDLLVAEPLRPALLRIPLAGVDPRAQPFGDTAFQDELRQLANERALWTKVRVGAQIAIVLGPLLGLFLLWRMGEPLTMSKPRTRRAPLQRPENTEPAAVHGWHWLTADPRARRRLRWLMGGHLTLVLIALGMFHWWFVGSLPASGVRQAGLVIRLFDIIMAVIVVFDLFMIVRGPANLRIRLGTDGQNLLLDRGGKPNDIIVNNDTNGTGGDIESYPLAAIATDGRQLLAGRHLIPISTPLGARFDRDEVTAYLLARMPQSAFVSPVEFVRRALQNGNRTMWALIVFLFAVVMSQVVALLFPALAAAWKAKLVHGVAMLCGVA
jgi:hypothetical protein